jgi:hypothetical protein
MLTRGRWSLYFALLAGSAAAAVLPGGTSWAQG